jgi:hypothetical protein
MIQDVFELLVSRWDFFAQLLVEHLEISFLAIAIAIVFGVHRRHPDQRVPEVRQMDAWRDQLRLHDPVHLHAGLSDPFFRRRQRDRRHRLTIYALLPMVKSVHTGLTNVDPAIVEAAKGMGSTRGRSCSSQAPACHAGHHVRHPEHGDDDHRAGRHRLLYRRRRPRRCNLSRHHHEQCGYDDRRQLAYRRARADRRFDPRHRGEENAEAFQKSKASANCRGRLRRRSSWHA